MIPPWKISGRLGNQMFQIAYLYSQVKEGIIPDIYLQDYRYFDKYREEICQLFGDWIYPRSEVGIHVRRGDYVDNSFYVNLTKTDYYKKAIDLFPKETEFFVFSDDIEFCKEYFKDFKEKLTFVEGGTEISDFNWLASCSSQIMANSSFSYWAGYLNPNPNKTVIYPSEWFSDEVERVICPSTWQKI